MTDRAAAELAEAERRLRENSKDEGPAIRISTQVRDPRDVRVVLAELDRQRALIAAVLAYLDKVEKDSEMFRRMHGGGLVPAIVEVPRIRALLEGEKR